MSRLVWASISLSLILHISVLLLVDHLFLEEREVSVFRARLASAPRFVQQQKLVAAAPTLLNVDMEYVRSQANPASLPESAVPLVAAAEAVAPPPGENYDPTLPKRDGAELLVEAMPDPTAPSVNDSAASEAMELLRIEDLVRADREKAVIILDVYSRRDTRGFVKFTPLRLNGVGGYGLDGQGGKPVLEDVARYVRDHTQVQAQLHGFPVEYFNSPPLRKDPLHFFFPGIQRGSTNGPRAVLGEEELVFLGEYLRGGGSLFIDAGQGPGDHRFLQAMVAMLKRVIGSEGRLFPLPANHAVYHAFYSYENGFPGELKRPIADIPGSHWYYPDQAPCTGQTPRGLYGVEWQGQTVAVISDLALHRGWSGLPSRCPYEGGEEPAEGGGGEAEPEEAPVQTPFLQAATNIIFYALTRPGGVAVKRQAPAWGKQRVQGGRPGVELEAEVQLASEDEDLLDDLEASLAFVRAPLGKRIGEGGLRLRIAGYGSVEIVDGLLHGALIRNLPSGPCWIEVEYGDEQQGMEIELRGGRVTTVAFSVRGLGFWSSLSLKPQNERFAVESWSERFGDLAVEEIYAELGE